MNTQMRKLAEQIVCFEQDMDGSMEPNENGQWIRADDLEKFAELIVRECANEILKWKSEPFPYDPEFGAKLIKEHFGIEE